VQPRMPWGVVDMNLDGCVHRFEEKPKYRGWCNGGYMVMDQRVFKSIGLLSAGVPPNTVALEDVLGKLSKAGELHAFKHGGFWCSCDTEKDRRGLDELWNSGNAPWRANDVGIVATHTA
jgi:glucose-1-phosphate cytidylyltransferase